jgi:hypothetical protein
MLFFLLAVVHNACIYEIPLSLSISLWFEEEEKAEESGGSFVKKKANVLQFFGNLMH